MKFICPLGLVAAATEDCPVGGGNATSMKAWAKQSFWHGWLTHRNTVWVPKSDE